MLDTITSLMNDNPIENLPNYMNYYVTYSDGIKLEKNQYLKSGETTTYKVRIEYKNDDSINPGDLDNTNDLTIIGYTCVLDRCSYSTNVYNDEDYVVPDSVKEISQKIIDKTGYQ